MEENEVVQTDEQPQEETPQEEANQEEQPKDDAVVEETQEEVVEETEEEKDDDGVNPDDFEPEARTTSKESEEPVKEEEEEIDPDDEKTISKVVAKRLSPLQEQVQQQKDELEINAYLSENPELKRYKPAIQKYVAHPAYKNIPIKNIAAIVSAKDMQKIGAEKERAAAKRAKQTKSPGQQVRTTSASKDYTAMSTSDFEKEIARAKGQRI